MIDSRTLGKVTPARKALLATVFVAGTMGGSFSAYAQGLQTQAPPTASPNPSSGQAPPLTPPSVGVAAAGASPLPSGASSRGATTLGEIVVTAQRRSENLQNVPIAVTALSGSSLSAAGVGSTADLSQVVPALSFTSSIGTFALPSIRGVGTTTSAPGLENPVATYIDGVYIVAPADALLGLHDISQVAVLKGPQGTLFGRNATGGLIQVTTLEPTTQPKLDVDASFGDRAYSAQDLYVSGGLIDKLTGNFAVNNDDLLQGFGHNVFNGDEIQTHRSTSMRGKLAWKPNVTTQVTLSADYSKYKASDPALRALGTNTLIGPLPGGSRDIDTNVQPFTHVEQWGLSLNARHDFDGFQVVSISAYRQTDSDNLLDGDGTPVPALKLDLGERDSQASEEIQFLSTTKGAFSWVAGAFYLHSRGAFDPTTTNIIGVPGPILDNAIQDLDSYSVFGQGTYKLAPATNLTAGIRYTLDHRSIAATDTLDLGFAQVPAAAPLAATKDFSAPTARLSIDHRFSPELLAYLSYNRGFKSGTFSPQSFPLVTIQPETLNAVEAGLKTDLLDRRVRLNLAGYFYDYSNKQTEFINDGQELLYDAKKAQMYGLDADMIVRLTANLQISAGLGLIHAVYTDFKDGPVTTPIASGDALANGSDSGNFIEDTPKYTINVGPSYRLPTPVGEFTANLNYFHSSGYFATPDNRLRQEPYDVLNADILFVPEAYPHISIDVWGKNLTDALYSAQLTETQFGDNRLPAPGETYGITIGLHY